MSPTRLASRLPMTLAALVLTLSLAWSLVWPSSCVAAESAILLGGTSSFSGKFSEPSLMIREAVRLWEKQTNWAGGLLGRPVRVILHDDASDPARVREVYQKLIDEDKVDILLSPYGTSLTLAALEVSEPRQRLMIGYAAAGDEIWKRGYSQVFGVFTTAERYFLEFLDMIARQGLDTVAILYEDNSFPADVAQGARQWAVRFGLKVLFMASYRDAGTELGNLVARSRESGAAALVLGAYDEDCHRLLKEMKRQGWRPRALAMTVGLALESFAQKAGELAEGVFGVSQWEPNLRLPFPGAAKFIADFVDQSGRMPTYHAAGAYTGLSIAARAVEHTGSLEQDKLKAFIWSLDTVTVIGRFKLDHTGRQIGHNPLVIQWQNSFKQIVHPLRMQTAAPRF